MMLFQDGDIVAEAFDNDTLHQTGERAINLR